jgi:hypothetical protein
MKQLLPFLFASWLVNVVNGDDLKVSATISGTGVTEDGHEACIVTAEVRNQTRESLAIVMMSCSWDESLFLSPEHTFGIAAWECRANAPDR